MAGEDLRAVRLCIAADPPLRSVAAYHCQQAAEKVLKGFLVKANVHFRKTHDLQELGDAVVARFPSVAALTAGLGDWATWSVAHRYPGEDEPEPEPTTQELLSAIEAITQLQDALRSLVPPGFGALARPPTE